MTRPLILTDLDDTLFRTLRDRKPGTNWVTAACDRDGQPISYMSPEQAVFCSWLFETADVIPVTGRNIAALQRVTLPFNGYAICSHGASILDEHGTMIEPWRKRMAAIAHDARALLEWLREQALGTGEDIRAGLVTDGGPPLYVSVKHNLHDENALRRVAQALAPSMPAGWMLHRNTNNLAAIPAGIDKKSALLWLFREYLPLGHQDGRPILALGDSLSDLPFLGLGHFAAFPANSQIAGLLSKEMA